jgi:hypothetical protein
MGDYSYRSRTPFPLEDHSRWEHDEPRCCTGPRERSSTTRRRDRYRDRNPSRPSKGAGERTNPMRCPAHSKNHCINFHGKNDFDHGVITGFTTNDITMDLTIDVITNLWSIWTLMSWIIHDWFDYWYHEWQIHDSFNHGCHDEFITILTIDVILNSRYWSLAWSRYIWIIFNRFTSHISYLDLSRKHGHRHANVALQHASESLLFKRSGRPEVNRPRDVRRAVPETRKLEASW